MNRFWACAIAIALVIPTGFAACKSDSEKHEDVVVNWSEVHQTIDGFGASSAFFGNTISEDMADQLFDAKKGIGLSLLRVMIGVPDDTKSDGSQPTEGAKSVATIAELTTAQQAIVRGAKVWATAWTPPPIWKTTNSKDGSGTDFKSNKLKPEHYKDYANYLAGFVEMMAKEQVPLVALSPLNEPDYTASWDNAQMSPDELATFIGEHLGPTFKSRCPAVSIVAPDTASWPRVPEYLKAILEKAKDYVPIIATHPYTNSKEPLNLNYQGPQENGKRFWETEWSQENMNGDTPDPTMTSAIDMMKKVHDHLTLANMSAWNWWAIYISAGALESADTNKIRRNPALIQPDKDMKDAYLFKRGYSLGHWSKFVRPGFKRIGATDHPATGVLIEAYRDDADHLVLTAINTSSKVVTQTFLIEGHSFGKLTPWVTSPDDSLSAKSSMEGGDSFTYDLPAQSVVSFVNWDATKETPNQGTLPVIPRDGGTGTDANTGRTSSGALDCASAMVPSNGGNGGVTDFADWKNSKWGNSGDLNGYLYGYASTGSSITAGVNADGKRLEVTGQVFPGQATYGGTGLSFLSCTKVTSFTQIQFTLAGSWPGCNLELQMKTFDQTPTSGNPAGSCAENCYQYPVKRQVAEPSTETKTITVPLSDLSNWSETNANQLIGLQWQWTTNGTLDPDAGVGCPIDAKISDIKFLP